MTTFISLENSKHLPFWRRPITLLLLMAIAQPVSFSTWSALLNNFVIEEVGFNGSDIGWLHTIREVPGFLAVGVIAIIIFVREQVLGLIALILLGIATAITAWYPSMGGILTITMLSSIGFHYFETVNQSLQLQWIEKSKAPKILGWIMAAGFAATLISYGLLVFSWKTFNLNFNFVYLVSGIFTVLVALFCIIFYPQFNSPTTQNKKIILRRRYWLYYALQFMSGARRQIFVVFAGFMMVERFGFEVHEITSLFMINLIFNILFAPVVGAAINKYGERRALLFEYTGLIVIFFAYGGIYWFGWGVIIASFLYVLDHIFFALALALKTYFQKIADPADIAPTAAVAFTINHIAAVFLPASLGYLWLFSPSSVFVIAALIALISFFLALLIPRHPCLGNETIL